MRKGKPQLQRIDIDELFSNSSNRGMLSFLERPPEEAQTRLREKQKVDEADSRRIAPVGELPPARMSPPANPEAAPPIPFSAQCKGRSAANGLDQPEGILPLPVSYPLVKSPAGDISPSPTGCEVNSLSPTGELLPGVGSREISPDFRLRFESYGGAIRPQGQLPTGSHLKTIIDGSVVGRRQKIRRAAVAQDGHSSGEQLLYQSLWNAAAVETPETRLLSVGYNGMSTLCKLDKSNCKKNIQSLIEKLAVQVAETYKSASSTGTTYRIFSYREILRRREAAGMVWVVRTSGVRFVNPMGDLPRAPLGDLPSNTVREAPTGARGKAPTPPVGEMHTPLGKSQNTEGTTSSALVRLALSQYGSIDDDALSRLIKNCQAHAGDCTEEEVIHFIHEKGAVIRRKGSRIQNPIGFLIDAVPKCFSGDAIRLHRQLSTMTRVSIEELNQEERDREWGREHEADLDNPSVPESVKDVIKKCLEGNKNFE